MIRAGGDGRVDNALAAPDRDLGGIPKSMTGSTVSGRV
jgi:hypothetical protein